MKAMRKITNNDDNDANYKISSKIGSKEEAIWRINYAISSKKPHEISFIDIDPNCLGSSRSLREDDACSFNFEDIEISPLYKLTIICKPKYNDDVQDEPKRVYLVKAKGKREMLLEYSYSEGSGGGSSSIELVDSSKKEEVCK